MSETPVWEETSDLEAPSWETTREADEAEQLYRPNASFPQLSPEATLPEILAQPEQDLGPYRGKMVPSSLPGATMPEWSLSVPSDQEPDTLTSAALGAGAGFLEQAAPRMAKAFGALSELMPLVPPGVPMPIAGISELQRKRMDRTAAQIASDTAINPAVQAGKTAEEFWKATIPRTEEEKQNWLSQAAETATGMAGYAVAGPLAPALIGAESYADHIVNDFEEGKQQGLSEEESGRKAMAKALASGITQAAVFEFLPKPLRKAGEKLIVDRFGASALESFLSKRVASSAQTAGLFSTSVAAENVISGRPITSGLAASALGGALFGAVTPYGATARERGEVPSAKPPATPEVIDQRRQSLLQKAQQSGVKVDLVEGDLPGSGLDIAHANPDGSIKVSLKNFNEWLDKDLSKGYSEEKAIENLINHETIHGVTPKELANDFEQSLTAFQRWKYRRQYHGAYYKGTKISGTNLGKEALRYEVQLASEMEPSEYIAHAKDAKATKFLNVLDKAVGYFRSRARTDAQKAMVERLKTNVNAALEAAKKGSQSASEITKAAEVYGDVQPLKESAQGLPAQKGVAGDVVQAEGRVAQAAQIPLKPQTDRGTATIKDPPVVKDVPPGSIPPDSIVPAIRLINGDVIHGWIKKNGKAATHPEIAKRYGVTVEELDRKGWISKDGKSFYEREPAAKGTGLPTDKKEGELHSTDKPKEAPPAAPTEGAQPVQATTGLATQPPEALTSGGPAAEAKVSTVSEQVKLPGFSDAQMSRLDQLNDKISQPGAKFNKAEYDEWAKLSDQMAEAESKAGVAPSPQGEAPAAMTRKRTLTPAVRSDDNPHMWVAGKNHADARLRLVGEHVEFQKFPQNEIFVDQDGNLHTRAAALKIFKEITGIENPNLLNKAGLSSEDFKNNGVEHLLNPEQTFSQRPAAMSRKKPSNDKERFILDRIQSGQLTPENVRISVQRDQVDPNTGKMIPGSGFIQVDEINPTLGNTFSSNPEQLAKLGLDIPSRSDLMKLPQGTYTLSEARAKIGGSPAAMSRKARSPEEEVVSRVTAAVGGIGNDKTKLELVTNVSKAIVKLPREQWGEALTQFQVEWKSAEIEAAAKTMAEQGLGPAEMEKFQKAAELTKKLSPENIEAVFGPVDRAGAYRSAIYVLNKKPVPVERIAEGAPTPTAEEIVAKGKGPVSYAVRPKYNVGDYKEFFGDFNERHPNIPEWVAIDVWNNAVDDFLNNASGETISTLLRPARLERRFLGDRLERVMPDPDPDPIISDIIKSPSPDQSTKFKAFWASRDMTPEQGIAELNRLREIQNQEMRELAKRTPTRPGMALVEGRWQSMTPEEQASYKESKSKGIVWKPGTRDPLTVKELRELESDRVLGRKINAKRRQNAISALKKWLNQSAKPESQSAMRRTVGLDDIWFETKEPGGAYAEYTNEQGQNQSFLKKVLGRGSIKGVTGTTSRFITVVVDPKTGDYHSVSTYVRDNMPRFYDPSGLPGSKVGDYIDLPQMLSRYRVAASMLVRDPVYNFHQVYRSEKGKSGQEKFNEDIGAVAKSREESSNRQWMKFVKQADAERAAEIERQRQERFFGGVKEGEVTGEAEGKPETTAELEAKPGEETTSREEEVPPSVREQMAKEREAAGAKPWEEADDWVGGEGREGRMTEASMQTWQQGKGRGAGALGMFQSDLRHLAEQSLVGAEAESLYELYHQNKVSHPLDFQRVLDAIHDRRKKTGVLSGRDISALYALDKIANRIHDRMATSEYEKAKTKHLPPIPKDTEYVDMTDVEKEHYVARESLKYRALLRAFNEVYDIAKESTGTSAAKGAAKGIPISEDVIAFRDRALDRYGDTARRDVESAAVSAQSATGRELETPGRAKRIPLEGGVTAGRRFPQVPPPPEMLPPGAATYEPAPPPAGAFPTIPTTPSMIGGEKFAGALPRTTPERATPVGVGEEAGYVPPDFPDWNQQVLRPMIGGKATRYQPSLIREAVEGQPPDPAAMTRKGVGPSRAAREEMRAQGRTTWQHEDAPVRKKEDLIAGGRDLVINKQINPEKEMRQFEVQEAKKAGSGYLSQDSTLAFRYWDYRLQGWADAMSQEYGPKSKEYKDAEAVSSAWKTRMENASSKMFAYTGLGLQGWNQIGPNDMRSTTFVRRFLKKSKAKEKGIEEEEYELTEEDEVNVQRITREVSASEDVVSKLSILVGEGLTKAQDPKLDPGQKQLVTQFDAIRKQARTASADILGKKKPPPGMAMKGKEGELPELDAEQMDALGNIGFDVMSELSKANTLTDAAWLKEMKKVLASDEVGRPDLEPYLPKVRAVSEQIRDTALNNYIGTGDAVKDARHIFTRKRPPIEESIAAIHRALQADPTGEKITPAEAFHVWNYLKTRFFDNGIMDFQVIREKGSAELAIKDSLLGTVTKPYPQLRLFRAISSSRSIRKMTDELVRKIADETRIKGQAMNWLKNQEYPGWLRTMRFFPRLFFFDKVMGHGFVPMVTHAPTLFFNPTAWSAYFGTYRNGKWKPGAWQEMYRMAIGTKPISRLASKIGIGEWKGETGESYHQKMTQELVMSERFQAWKHAGLQVDPFKYTDDYQIQALQNIFGKRFNALTGGRGFDALKTLRYAMAEKWLRSLPEHLQNKKSMELISDSVNHATGIVKTRFHEAFNWAMFAPKLEGSRWAYLFKDTIKALDIIRRWKSASLEERAWATRDLKQKASVVGWYIGMLAMNQAFLKMVGSDQEVNTTDPKKADFLQFKVAGFRVGVTSPFVGMIRLFSNALHAAFGERTKFEQMDTRQVQLGEKALKYARGKASPFASFAIDAVTQEDVFGRKFPWSTERPTRREMLTGKKPYTKKEYFLQTFAPIPIEEAIKETFRSQGMSDNEATRWLRILTIAGGMSATGARVADEELEQ